MRAGGEGLSLRADIYLLIHLYRKDVIIVAAAPPMQAIHSP